MKCNLCGCSIFLDTSAKSKVMCKNCGSHERTRLLWLYISKYKISEQTKILHVAPEKGLYLKLSSILPEGNYRVADYNPDLFPFAHQCEKIDLCDLKDEKSNNYNFIIHSHVLEHTYCNIAYTLFHLHRMLKVDGRHICIIPFMGGYYDESFANLPESERKVRFGQFDHTRRFGCADVNRHLGSILNLVAPLDAISYFSEDELHDANIDKINWKGLHTNTVLDLAKDDYLLCDF